MARPSPEQLVEFWNLRTMPTENVRFWQSYVDDKIGPGGKPLCSAIVALLPATPPCVAQQPGHDASSTSARPGSPCRLSGRVCFGPAGPPSLDPSRLLRGRSPLSPLPTRPPSGPQGPTAASPAGPGSHLALSPLLSLARAVATTASARHGEPLPAAHDTQTQEQSLAHVDHLRATASSGPPLRGDSHHPRPRPRSPRARFSSSSSLLRVGYRQTVARVSTTRLVSVFSLARFRAPLAQKPWLEGRTSS